MQAIDEFVLKEKYRDRESCKWAAKGEVAGVAADFIGGSAQATSLIDTATGFALMRCAGMSTLHIIAYQVGMLCFGAVLFFLTIYLSPSWPPPAAHASSTGAGRTMGIGVAVVVVGIVHAVVMFVLKDKVFTTKALIGDMLLR